MRHVPIKLTYVNFIGTWDSKLRHAMDPMLPHQKQPCERIENFVTRPRPVHWQPDWLKKIPRT
jgi:hypothetical protein